MLWRGTEGAFGERERKDSVRVCPSDDCYPGGQEDMAMLADAQHCAQQQGSPSGIRAGKKKKKSGVD
jgi:hypothetical protein